jgi:hypothetical protein
VPLFKEAAGALVVTYVSVLMLPIVANLELLMRFGNWREPSTKVGAVFAILTAVFAIWTVVEIHRLRRLWFKF